jgi:hypothetical protein
MGKDILSRVKTSDSLKVADDNTKARYQAGFGRLRTR